MKTATFTNSVDPDEQLIKFAPKFLNSQYPKHGWDSYFQILRM